VSTAGGILKRHGLVSSRRRRPRRSTIFKKPEIQAGEPNDLWTTDFKGEFRLGDRRLCYPLTAMDHVSRYLLGCRARESVAIAGARPVFEALFRRFGLPRAILCDNGSPFAAVQAPCRLSRLSVWWVRLGIVPIFIQPGHPEQNAAHERMHRTLKAETTRPPSASFETQQRSFDRFRREYNTERPHEALELDRPEERYEPSVRPYPETVPEIDYPGHYEVRRVSPKGTIRWRQRKVFFSESLARERIGLEEVDEGLWSIYLADLLLGRYDDQCGETEWL
jgi:transposase InsO family protein